MQSPRIATASDAAPVCALSVVFCCTNSLFSSFSVFPRQFICLPIGSHTGKLRTQKQTNKQKRCACHPGRRSCVSVMRRQQASTQGNNDNGGSAAPTPTCTPDKFTFASSPNAPPPPPHRRSSVCRALALPPPLPSIFVVVVDHHCHCSCFLLSSPFAFSCSLAAHMHTYAHIFTRHHLSPVSVNFLNLLFHTFSLLFFFFVRFPSNKTNQFPVPHQLQPCRTLTSISTR